ncbi:MAG: 30S ribosomal protein S6 [Buchnera aphidicola (Eriosoma harunire)]
MRNYEIVLLIHPDHSDKVSNMIEKYKKMITKHNGKIYRLEDWGKKQLAYSINKLHKAHYILMNILVESNTIGDLEKIFRFDDLIIRNIILFMKDPITHASPMLTVKEDNKFDIDININ